MDAQTIINIAIGLCGALGGYVLNGLKDSIHALHKADTDLTSKVQSIEVLIAGDYVRHDALDRLTTAIFAKLDRIENKLDGKQDK